MTELGTLELGGRPGSAAAATRLRVTDLVHVAIADRTLWIPAPPVASDEQAAREIPSFRRAEHLAARALLRALLADLTGGHPATPIATHPTGQLYLHGQPDVAISVSHDAGHIAAAAGLGVAVGIDVQLPVAVSDAMLRRCCLPAVCEALRQLPDPVREREFAWIWTVQEACVKAHGTGLAGQPWTIPVQHGQREGHWRDLTWVSLRGRTTAPVSVAYGPQPHGGQT